MRPRPLRATDLPGLARVQAACYGAEFVESEALFARRLSSPANSSLVLTDGAGAVVAYLAAYRSLFGKVTPLHGEFEPVAAPDTLYLHDMAVLPECAGRGLAQQLLAALRAGQPELRRSALVAVQGAEGYWARQGYAAHTLSEPLQRQRLASYGPGALYMQREL